MANYGDRNYSCEYQWRRMDTVSEIWRVTGRKYGFYLLHPSSPAKFDKVSLPFEYWDEIRIST